VVFYYKVGKAQNKILAMPTIAKANSQLIAQSHATQTRKKRLKVIATLDIVRQVDIGK